ncbi:SpoIIE family protein phosphatase, partial [bacterium]|nr:SpoIIE family protein phosphatase [bacterium]
IYIDTCRLLRETYVPSLIKELQDRFGFNTALKKHFVSERKFHADDIFRSETDIIVERLFIHNQESGACVLSRVSGAFSSIEREMFKMVTGALTAVINNIIMYRELERSNRRLNWAKKKLLESNERSDDKEHEHAMKLENLYEAGKMLTTIHEPSRLLATLTYMIINAIDAEVGAAILFDGNTVTEKIEFGLNFSVIKDIRIKQNGKEISLFNYIIETGEMIVLNKEEIKERLILDTLPFIQISTLACVPLQTNLSTSGIMLTVNKLKGKTYTKDDIEALKTLSSMATVAIQNAYLYHQKIEKTKLEADIKMAMEIQKELLPGSPPRNAIFDVASIYTPAEVMGGDYFDYIEVDTNHTGFLVADVTGHGVPAAFIVTLVKSCVQLTAYGKQSPQEVLKALNEFLCRHIPKKNFVSMGYGIIDTVRRTLAYSSAGHNPLLWYSHNTDTFTEIKTDGLFLSLFEDTLFGETTVQLGNNDILVFYTDGLTEAKNKSGEFFGIERIKEIIQKFGHHPAQHIAGLITDSLNEFLDGCALHDDLTSILVKITRSTSFFIPAGN